MYQVFFTLVLTLGISAQVPKSQVKSVFLMLSWVYFHIFAFLISIILKEVRVLTNNLAPCRLLNVPCARVW